MIKRRMIERLTREYSEYWEGDKAILQDRVARFVDAHVFGLAGVFFTAGVTVSMIGFGLLVALMMLLEWSRPLFVFVLAMALYFPLQIVFRILLLEIIAKVFGADMSHKTRGNADDNQNSRRDTIGNSTE